MEFWPILTFFIDCGHIYVPKGAFWGSTSRPHIGDVVISLFFTLGSTVHDKKWSILDQKWPNMAGLSTLQSGPKGFKRDQNGQPKCFDHLGPLLGPSGPFWTISDKTDFFAPNGQSRVWQRCFGTKYQFLFEMVQKGPDGLKKVPNCQKHLGWPFWSLSKPFGPLWSVDKPATLVNFRSKMDHFWAIPSHERSTQSEKKAHHHISYVYPACRTLKRPFWNINMAAIYEKCQK